MANISFFFPKERKGSALGVNAGLGNLGVSVVQFLSPIVVTAGLLGIFGGDPQTITKGGAQVLHRLMHVLITNSRAFKLAAAAAPGPFKTKVAHHRGHQ